MTDHLVSRPRPPGWPQHVMGELALRVGLRAGQSVALEQFHQGALRVLRPHYFDPWQVSYTAINPGGGYLGGDDYLFNLQVDAGAGLLLTSQSATKVYRTAGAPARQHTQARVSSGALLELLPEPLIVYREGRYRQTTVVDLEPGATCVIADVITPGWSPNGSHFGYHDIALRTLLRGPDAEPILLDHLLLRPPDTPVAGLGLLDGFTHAGSMLIYDARVDQQLIDQIFEVSAAHQGLRVGVSLAPGPTAALRVLGNSTAAIDDLILDVDATIRQQWFSLPRVNLRKI